MTLHTCGASQDRQRIKSEGPTIIDLMHKHTLESTDKEGVTLREEYDYVPSEVLGSAGYHAEPDWCGCVHARFLYATEGDSPRCSAILQG